jgi:predicted dehydrogenase
VTETLTALVVGCGRIGGEAPPPGSRIDSLISHAAAYDRHPDFHLRACVEPDHTKRRAFMDQWGVETGFASLDDCRAAGMEFDVASVCTPTPEHAAALWTLLATPVSAVFCEKPLTDDGPEARRLVAAYNKVGRPLTVNFTRRWHPALAELKNEIEAGDWGRLRAAVGYYTKGVRNNGSHLIDLAHYLIGPTHLLAVTGSRIDHTATDPTVDAVLSCGDGVRLHLIGGDARDYALFEMHLITERGAIGIERSGRILRRRRTEDDPLAAGYRLLEADGLAEVGPGGSIYRAVDELARVVRDGAAPSSDGDNALAAQLLCEEIIDGVTNLVERQ